MEIKSPINTHTNTNLPSTQTAHSDIPMGVENHNHTHNHNPHTNTGTETGTVIESRNAVNTSHSEINTQPPPPSYNAHADQHSSEKRTVENNHHGGNENETPPQFQIRPDVLMNADGNAGGGGNGGGKYEGQYPAPLTSLQKESRLVRCPRCGVCEYTGVEWVSGGTADISALLCCLCFCLPCVPYLMTSFKDVHHKCANCGFLVAVWKRSGKTEVSVAASAAAASGNAGGVGGAGGK
ncbi:uncharacterized protein EAE98_006168 [Botrytis deweyae]|uniref:LITAF domain-containing protein n=1 Tax=Botrytis deweyae TaxID=2478750 RepID=A0ABQ7IMA6_9HELO|nr:uncharacterized protein EAE98_006168 [Botrytis deweyae]KAF7927786.1 hypothetical protein EAE98_006168 [Botrytis deweyae]